MRLHTLGRLELVPDAPGKPPVAAQPKRLALLTYLALATPRGPQGRDVLLGLFWPELDQEPARRALRQALHHLRHFLGEGVLVSRWDDVVGVAEGSLWCDAAALEDAIAAGRARHALELYRGDFLRGCFLSDISAEFEQWVDRTGATVKRRAAQAAQSVAEEEARAGNARAAILAGRRAMELAPDDESVVRELLGLHHRMGDDAGALRTYEEFARRMAEEFGASPSALTRAVVQSLRAAPIAPAKVTPSAAPDPRPAAPDPPSPVSEESVGAPHPAEPAAPRIPEAGAPAETAPRSRTIRWRAATMLTAALVAAGIGVLTRRAPPVPTPNPALVAVLPFRTVGAAPELGWLHEGMVDLLALELGGQAGSRVVDPRVVMRAWRHGAGTDSSELTPELAIAVARRAGAGRAIDGAVLGTPARLTLTAAVLQGPDGSVGSRASVAGPMDSLPTLLDQLAARLLSLEAGTERARFSAISSRSLPAIRAYLGGRAAFRHGQLREARDRFLEATVQDSTFALAALELVHASKWVDTDLEVAERGRRLALAGKERLGPADRALLDVWTRPFPTRPELLDLWRAAARAYPAYAEVWYGLADAYYHFGLLAGLADPFALAGDAFRRGWALDSAGEGDRPVGQSPMSAEPLGHLVELAQLQGDTATVRRLTASGLQEDSGARGWYLRWHQAVAAGARAQRAFWADSARMDPETFTLIHRFTASSGIGTDDYLRAGLLMLRQWEVRDPGGAGFERRVLALNGGRPGEAARALAGNLDAPDVSVGLPVREALYWGGDTALAAEAAWRLVSYADAAGAVGGAAQRQVQAVCTLATWRQEHGDNPYAAQAIRRLRRVIVRGLAAADSIAVTQYATLCAALLEASRAAALHLPYARAALELADSAARTYEVGQSLGANLVVARVAEAEGNLPFALRAIRRRATGYDLLPLWYLSTFLREEGRLAALTGDTAGAIRAYRHYLAMRPDPEAVVKPEVDGVRAELGRLIGR